MADDGMQHSNISKDSDEIINSRSVLLKILEVILDVVAISLVIVPFESFQEIYNKPRISVSDLAIVHVTVIGYIIINGLFIFSHFIGDRMPRRTVLLFLTTGTLLHVIAGSVMINSWRRLGGDYTYTYNNHTYPSKLYMDMFISSSIITLLNALLFGTDVFMTIRYF